MQACFDIPRSDEHLLSCVHSSRCFFFLGLIAGDYIRSYCLISFFFLSFSSGAVLLSITYTKTVLQNASVLLVPEQELWDKNILNPTNQGIHEDSAPKQAGSKQRKALQPASHDIHEDSAPNSSMSLCIKLSAPGSASFCSPANIHRDQLPSAVLSNITRKTLRRRTQSPEGLGNQNTVLLCFIKIGTVLK